MNQLATIDKETLLKNCNSLEIHLTDGNHKDINGRELFDELCALKNLFKNELSILNNPLDMLKFLHVRKLPFPNLFISLRILLTIPISVASGERSFSRLKIIKNYLRSSISQERLTNLSLIAIENDVCCQLDMSDLISKFVSAKIRKIKLQ